MAKQYFNDEELTAFHHIVHGELWFHLHTLLYSSFAQLGKNFILKSQSENISEIELWAIIFYLEAYEYHLQQGQATFVDDSHLY